jgi:hypothetical protein
LSNASNSFFAAATSPFFASICASAYRAEGDYRATLDVATVLGFDPVVTAARYALAQMLAKKGDVAAAKQQFDALLKQWEHADTEFSWLLKVREARKKLGD